ncbi:hypothetical protein MAMC_01472 [Methylacidimicrobium cyclopophantes]|uniref:Uncharacterized protein n=1 Tax=Methylacidimicrobium cyclopophantes TaxID=1041766 RepID=A0A5E6MD89_9BACT|nr:ABC-type transport auxiliary lipoprotein family protein [Methylacidimicrobium cyclopophantes]VVM07170.1 hypothetical protein MAMC_01472 [Methylacidimicrobium cyclopophantes]
MNGAIGTLSWVFLLFFCLPLLGCISRPNRLPSESFGFVPSVVAPSKTDAPKPTLVLRSVRVVPAYAGQDFVYRAADYRFERDPYAHFLTSPELLIRSAVSDSLQNSGLFQMVVAGGSAVLTHSFAEISVRELYGDFRPRSSPAAVISLRFLVIQAPGGNPLWEGTISRRIPLRERSASALMEGWSTGLRQILVEAGPLLAKYAREADLAAQKAAENANQTPAPTLPKPKS